MLKIKIFLLLMLSLSGALWLHAYFLHAFYVLNFLQVYFTSIIKKK